MKITDYMPKGYIIHSFPIEERAYISVSGWVLGFIPVFKYFKKKKKYINLYMPDLTIGEMENIERIFIPGGNEMHMKGMILGDEEGFRRIAIETIWNVVCKGKIHIGKKSQRINSTVRKYHFRQVDSYTLAIIIARICEVHAKKKEGGGTGPARLPIGTIFSTAFTRGGITFKDLPNLTRKQLDLVIHIGNCGELKEMMQKGSREAKNELRRLGKREGGKEDKRSAKQILRDFKRVSRR